MMCCYLNVQFQGQRVQYLMSEKRHNYKLSEISLFMVYFITETNVRQSVAAKHKTHHHTMKCLNHS